MTPTDEPLNILAENDDMSALDEPRPRPEADAAFIGRSETWAKLRTGQSTILRGRSRWVRLAGGLVAVVTRTTEKEDGRFVVS